jgi:hypothetical protein
MSYYVATPRRRRPHSNLATLLIITSRRHINILEVARSIRKVFFKRNGQIKISLPNLVRKVRKCLRTYDAFAL